jgi:hypothetical protein
MKIELVSSIQVVVTVLVPVLHFLECGDSSPLWYFST